MLPTKLMTVLLLAVSSPIMVDSLPRRWSSYLFLFPGSPPDRLLLVRDSVDSYWQLPGGGSEAKDRLASSPFFATMKREYEEETGEDLPRLSDLDKLENGDNQLFYYGKSSSLNLPSNNQLYGDGEVTEWRLFGITELRRGHRNRRALDTAVQRGIISRTRGLAG